MLHKSGIGIEHKCNRKLHFNIKTLVKVTKTECYCLAYKYFSAYSYIYETLSSTFNNMVEVVCFLICD